MDGIRHVSRFLGAITLFALSAGVHAETTFKSSCMSIGPAAPEQLPGRDGQSVSAANYVCQLVGGPLDGATLTGNMIWHWDKEQAKSLGGSGVVRKPGAHAVYQSVDAQMQYIKTNGQVTGIMGSGRARYTLGSGAADAVQGKTYRYTFKSTGPGRFEVENTLE